MSDLEPLNSQLLSQNARIRANAVKALVNIPLRQALHLLSQSIHDPARRVRCAAADTLRELGGYQAQEILISALATQDGRTYTRVVRALTQIGSDAAIRALIEEVALHSESRKYMITENIITIGRSAINELKSAYYKSDGKTKAYYLKALGKIGSTEANDVFLDALANDDKDVFWVATTIQRSLRQPEAVPVLIRMLNHSKPQHQRGAAQTLQVFRDERAIGPLLAIVSDPFRDKWVRFEAIIALALNGGAKAVEPLLDLANGDNKFLSEVAYAGLSITGDPRAVRPILNAASTVPKTKQTNNPILNSICNFGHQGNSDILAEMMCVLEDGPEYQGKVLSNLLWSIEYLRTKLGKG